MDIVLRKGEGRGNSNLKGKLTNCGRGHKSKLNWLVIKLNELFNVKFKFPKKSNKSIVHCFYLVFKASKG